MNDRTARESWDSYFMRLALAASSRATCPRRKVGAVLTQNNRVRATGYNGSAPGAAHCLDVGCQLSEHGRCTRTIHAEVNLLAESTPAQLQQATVWVTDHPCPDCAAQLAAAPLARVVYLRPYHLVDQAPASHQLLAAGILLQQYQPQLAGDLPAAAESR